MNFPTLAEENNQVKNIELVVPKCCSGSSKSLNIFSFTSIPCVSRSRIHVSIPLEVIHAGGKSSQPVQLVASCFLSIVQGSCKVEVECPLLTPACSPGNMIIIRSIRPAGKTFESSCNNPRGDCAYELSGDLELGMTKYNPDNCMCRHLQMSCI
jgi:hypothetical protein